MQIPVTIVTPCYNEGAIAVQFLQQLQPVLGSLPYSFRVIIVDDGSTDNTLQLLRQFQFTEANISLEITGLDTNAGHQAAIYQGFLYALRSPGEYFIVMDCDGQDAPAVIPALLAHKDASIVNVARGNRKEPPFFRFCYFSYKALFRMFTGKQMNFGNFCLVSRAVIIKAVELHFTHLAAFLAKQDCTKQLVIAEREKRIGGKSKMGYRKLLHHAMNSFTEYGSFKGATFR